MSYSSSSSPAPTGTPITVVFYEDTGERVSVTGICRGACELELEYVRELRGPFVVSPRGIAHHAGYAGVTDCGADATRKGWWWPC